MAIDFWSEHGWLFLIAMYIFPRTTLLLATSIPFSIWTWMGWLVFPRYVAAFYATWFYWEQNPVLCCVAWFAAVTASGFGGEASRRMS